MATFRFELVSPGRISFSGEVDQVDVPGSEGDFGVLAGHAPLIALLRPGLMTVYVAGEKTELAIFGGFADTRRGRRRQRRRGRDRSRWPVAARPLR